MVDVVSQHIEVVDGAGGPKARIVGHRILVQDIAIWHEKLGMTPDEIVSEYPSLTMADVHAALAYYWDHRADIERAIQEGNALAESLRTISPGPLLEKLTHRPR
jgi:uncharacterized protein (DUF433 family)